MPYDLFTGETETLNGKSALLVCCIAKPEPLIEHTKSLSDQVHVLSYPDHHYFLSKDMEEIGETYENWKAPNKVIVTTEKDATRLHLQKEKLAALKTQVIVLPIKINFLFQEAETFDRLVGSYVESALEEHRQYGMPFPG